MSTLRACAAASLLVAAGSTLEAGRGAGAPRGDVPATAAAGASLSPDRCAELHASRGVRAAAERARAGPPMPLDAPRPAPYPLVPPVSDEPTPDERRILERARARQASLSHPEPRRGGEWIEGAVRTQLRHWLRAGTWDVAHWTDALAARYPTALLLRIERGALRRLSGGVPGYRKHRTAAFHGHFSDVAALDPGLNVTFVAFPSDGCPGNARPRPEPSAGSCPLECEPNGTAARPAGGAAARAAAAGACALAPRAVCKCAKLVAQPRSVSVAPGVEPRRLPLPVLCFQKDAQNAEAALMPELELLFGRVRGSRSKRKGGPARAGRPAPRAAAQPPRPLPPRAARARAPARGAAPRARRRLRVRHYVLPGAMRDARGGLRAASYEYRANLTLQNDLPWGAKRGGVAYFAGALSGEHHGLLNQRARVCSAHELLQPKAPPRRADGTRGASARALIAPLPHPSGLACRLILPPCAQQRAPRPPAECADGSVLGTARRTSWGEALEHRYILSMDGYGAACSRAYLALRSASVLLKLEGARPLLLPSALYVHSALLAWKHFVPVGEGGVHQTVAWLDAHEGVAREIAQAGAAFARDEYTYDNAVRYSHLLLHVLAQLHGRAPPAAA